VNRRIPFVEQLEGGDCGLACLAMVLGYFGRPTPVEELREASSVGRDGTNAREMLATARRFGLQGRGVRLELEQLELLEPGAVLHWQFRHFVVFERAHRGWVDIVDPAHGRRRVRREALGEAFTGVALVFEPAGTFTTRRKGADPVWRYLFQFFREPAVLSRILVLSGMIQVFALALPVLTAALVDEVLPREDWRLLRVLGVGFALIVAFHLVAALLRAHALLHLRTRLDARLTVGFAEHLVSLPCSFFHARSSGDLLNRLNSNSTIREILASSALAMVLDGVMVCSFLVILLVANAQFGAIVLLLGGLQVVVVLATRHQRRELTAHSLEAEAAAAGFQVEMIAGIQTLKCMGAEAEALSRWSDLYVAVLNAALRRGRLGALTEALTGALRVASPLVLLFLGAFDVLDGRMTLGTMLGLNALAAGFLGPIGSLVGAAGQFQLLGSYLNRVLDVVETEPEQPKGQARRLHVAAGAVALEGVSFRYGPRLPDVVRNVSLNFQPGQFVAIVGRSGAGKTTLAQLLIGMLVPTQGRVLFDGVDLNALDLPSLRRQIGAVLQDVHLFRGSIRRNIALGNPALPLETVRSAARLAQIDAEIVALPMGYETLLGDGGASLSGGQKQRIALARALVQHPSILLLDEATNALDGITESAVQEAVSGLRGTRIVIAHRLSTVRDADLVLVMDSGELVEAGRHDELLHRGGAYSRLIASQARGWAA
jgi:ATP-binding cassette, subfamily B, bacterial